MDMNDYQHRATVFDEMYGPTQNKILVTSIGLVSEVGEVCDLVKKKYGHGKGYSRGQMLSELGDVLWYLSMLAKLHDITLEEVAVANLRKLALRYKLC